MPLLERILTPINSLLPDISRVPQRRQAVGAIVASLVLHFVLLLLFLAIAAIIPDSALEVAKPNQELTPLEVQIITPPQEEELITPEELRAAAQRPIIDSTGLAKATEAPKDSIFESDENMKAGSQEAPTGDLPLPSQEGRDLPFPQFTDQKATLGPTSAPPSPGLPSPPIPPAAAPPPRPKVAEAKPKQPASEPKATPPPKLPETPEVKPDEIVIAQKPKPRTSAPELAPQSLPEAEPERQEMAKLTTPSPKRSRQSGYQPEQIKTRVAGNISNRGPRGVNAEKTPLGRYNKQVNAQIGSRWHYYMGLRRDLYATGTVHLSFSITADGQVRDVRVLDNTSNDAFALMCQQCVIEAEITPPPVEAEAVMPNGLLERELNFNYVPF